MSDAEQHERDDHERLETREWLESLEWVLHSQGAGRTRPAARRVLDAQTSASRYDGQIEIHTRFC